MGSVRLNVTMLRATGRAGSGKERHPVHNPDEPEPKRDRLTGKLQIPNYKPQCPKLQTKKK